MKQKKENSIAKVSAATEWQRKTTQKLLAKIYHWHMYLKSSEIYIIFCVSFFGRLHILRPNKWISCLDSNDRSGICILCTAKKKKYFNLKFPVECDVKWLSVIESAAEEEKSNQRNKRKIVWNVQLRTAYANVHRKSKASTEKEPKKDCSHMWPFDFFVASPDFGRDAIW